MEMCLWMFFHNKEQTPCNQLECFQDSEEPSRIYLKSLQRHNEVYEGIFL